MCSVLSCDTHSLTRSALHQLNKVMNNAAFTTTNEDPYPSVPGQKRPRDCLEAEGRMTRATSSSPFLCCTVKNNVKLTEDRINNRQASSLDEVSGRPFFLLPDSDTIVFNGEGDTVKAVAISYPAPKEVAVLKDAALTLGVIQMMTEAVASEGKRHLLPYLLTEHRSSDYTGGEGFEILVFNTSDWSLHAIIDRRKRQGQHFIDTLVLSPSGTRIGMARNDGHQVLFDVYSIEPKSVSHSFVATDCRLQWDA